MLWIGVWPCRKSFSLKGWGEQSLQNACFSLLFHNQTNSLTRPVLSQAADFFKQSAAFYRRFEAEYLGSFWGFSDEVSPNLHRLLAFPLNCSFQSTFFISDCGCDNSCVHPRMFSTRRSVRDETRTPGELLSEVYLCRHTCTKIVEWELHPECFGSESVVIHQL